MHFEYLKNCINGSLSSCQMMTGIGSALLNKNRSKIFCRGETVYWKYIESLNFKSPNDVAYLAKNILGFYNSIGGALVIGVASDYSIVGVPDWQLPEFENLSEILNDYFDLKQHFFIGKLKVGNKKTIVLIFVLGRKGPPAKPLINGPKDKDEKPIIIKDQYYIRQENNLYECTDPSDFERYFIGVSPDNIQSYLYKVDEPYYRLLAPHYGRFFGRDNLLDKVNQALKSRHPIIALDGVGGVGKSAIAIRLLDYFYGAQKYLFIVSLSAKNKVWTGAGHIGSRKAGFSGYTEFIREISKVLQLNINTDIEKLETQLLKEMKGLEGLLLIDNIEDIQDSNILTFLSEKVPDPVKVLVTSRIDRKLGAKTIPIPQMQYGDAKNLLIYELEQFGYTKFIDEPEYVDDILKATGCVPLAIKWAAAITGKYNSLKQASSEIRKTNRTKQEFLDFCLSTMYDALSPTAKKTALLYPYLANEWNKSTISALLDETEENVQQYINELEDKGLMNHSEGASKAKAYFLPLTIDFLSSNWNKNKVFNTLVRNRLSDLFTSSKFSLSDYEGILFNWSYEQRFSFIRSRAQDLIIEGDYNKAHKLIRIARNWTDDPKISFLEGRILYDTGKKIDGLDQMQSAHRRSLTEGGLNPDDSIFLANALLDHGHKKQEHDAFEIINGSVLFSDTLPEGLVEKFCKRAESLSEYSLLATFLTNILKRKDKQVLAYDASKNITLENGVVVFSLGNVLVRTLLHASKSDLCTAEEKNKIVKKKTEIENMLKNLRVQSSQSDF